ncbi:MAG: tetratricopeptide repeat protein [Chitinivorax sp.]
MTKPRRISAHQPVDIAGIDRLIQAGQVEMAWPSLRALLSRNPLNVAALRMQGDILQGQGALLPAMEAYQRSLSVQTTLPALKGMLAVAESLWRFDVVEQCLRALIRIEPDSGYYFFRLAQVLGVYPGNASAENAINCLRQCIVLQYQVKESYCQIGRIAHSSLGKFELANTAFRKALEIDPEYVGARLGLANLYCENNHIEAAIELLQGLMTSGCNDAEMYKLLGLSWHKLGHHARCLEFMRQATLAAPDNAELFSTYLFVATYTNQLSPQEWLAEHERFGAMVAARARPYDVYQVEVQPQKRLRVGFVSGDFRNHSVNYFFEPLLRERDRQALEVYCYYNNVFRDEVTDRLQAGVEGWRDVAALGDAALARQIHDDQIDILIDLSVHSARNRLPMFAWRPAPVQISWLGYPGTTGVKAVDYIMLDRHYLPPAEYGRFAVEEPLLLDGYRVYQPMEYMHKFAIRPLPALEKGHFTFGAFNDFVKVDSRVLDMWVSILQRLPTAHLALIVHAQESLEYVKKYFTERGIAAERLMISERLAFNEFLALHGQVDLALDTTPFTGLTTAMHGLWMGVPAITLAGARTTSRSGLSLLAALGLEAFVAGSEQEYVEIACRWADDLPRLAEIRAGLRDRLLASPLMDYPGFARNFEATLRQSWQTWCETPRAKTLQADSTELPPAL